MSLSLYEASVGLMAPMLKNLSAILGKAEGHACAATIADARLAPDMLPFTKQIFIATDTAKGAAARLAGVDNPVYEDVETTNPELRARIAKTVAFLESVDAAAVSGADDKAIQLKFPNVTLDFTGKSYVTTFVLPNFYFHVSMAYALLRSAGVEIGKRDYLGG